MEEAFERTFCGVGHDADKYKIEKMNLEKIAPLDDRFILTLHLRVYIRKIYIRRCVCMCPRFFIL